MADGKEVIVQDQEIILSPAEVVENATAQARLLMNIVNQTKCYQEISGKKYLQVEAWETIGAFNRTHAETKEITPIIKEDEVIGYAAHVQLWKDGIIVGGAIMPCYFTENCCKGKTGEAKHKACMSAAQTFATSKAYRMNFSYVAILAGFQPTPAEEITEDFATDQTEHWCSIHQTQFFKKGKMKGYAHSIKDAAGNDTGEWCNESEEGTKAKIKVGLPLPTGDFKNLGEFYTACLDYFKLTKTRVDAEVSGFDLTKPDQLKKAWETIVSIYGHKKEAEDKESKKD